ncbi:zeta toxin family protein [Puniceicoccus vermicola]|uniref:Zeta toxin family protein n=1 Tax=Puniceicoccus vermicola TaxID=388746 RepID=A0A7X1B1K2_9BACT|nr:zeta toxin family protein [Puniceicoccus vermicola]MBC2603941.1 zeta toxin family protein [Puniceicoccus vermicola]
MPNPTIFVLAGVNGSGKSSIGGANLVAHGVEYYNPDAAAKTLRKIHPNLSQALANGHAWTLGKEMLEKAIERRETYAFETTLGGTTITQLLTQAAQEGLKVKIWYVGLASVEQNLARVKKRVTHGGHDIPEAAIRTRWNSSRRNLIQLLPHLYSLRLFDNSQETDPKAGETPVPKLLLQVDQKRIVGSVRPDAPEWAKPILAGALHVYRSP